MSIAKRPAFLASWTIYDPTEDETQDIPVGCLGSPRRSSNPMKAIRTARGSVNVVASNEVESGIGK